MIIVEPDSEGKRHRGKRVATRVTELGAAAESFNVWRVPEGPCLVIGCLGGVSQKQSSRKE